MGSDGSQWPQSGRRDACSLSRSLPASSTSLMRPFTSGMSCMSHPDTTEQSKIWNPKSPRNQVAAVAYVWSTHDQLFGQPWLLPLICSYPSSSNIATAVKYWPTSSIYEATSWLQCFLLMITSAVDLHYRDVWIRKSSTFTIFIIINHHLSSVLVNSDH